MYVRFRRCRKFCTSESMGNNSTSLSMAKEYNRNSETNAENYQRGREYSEPSTRHLNRARAKGLTEYYTPTRGYKTNF